MRRFALPLVIVGSLAILVMLVLLLRSITHTSPTETATAAPSTTAPTVAATSPSSTGGAARSAPMPPSIARPRSDDSPSRPSGGDSPPNLAGGTEDGAGAPGTRANTKNLQFGLPQLREKIAGNAAKVAECIGNSKPTGEAIVTFILAQRQGKIVVETTDVDHEKTTLKDDQLVECLHKTAFAMQFDGLPREAEAIIVTRSISMTDGAVTEDKPVKFSYMR